MDKFNKIVIGILFLVVSVVLHAFVISQFWSWFIMSVFVAAPYVSLKQAVGLSVFITALSPKSQKTDTKELDFSHMLLVSIIADAIVLAIGLAYHFILT